MAEYISRETMINLLQSMADNAEANGFSYDREVIEAVRVTLAGIPAADVAPVVHGRWVYHNFDTICSECRKSAIFDEWEQQAETEFCPHCGAKMDGEEHNG